MIVAVSLIDLQSNETLHGINCECEEVYIAFTPGQAVQIKGTEYIVDHIVRAINGHTTFKVYVKSKNPE